MDRCGYCQTYITSKFYLVYDDDGRRYCTTAHRDAQRKLEHRKRVLAYQEQLDARGTAPLNAQRIAAARHG